MMQKMENLQKSRAVLLILAVVYTVVVFAAPFYKNSIFWVSYLFTVFSVASQLFVWRCAWDQEEHSVKSRFFGLPIIMVGIIYLLLQFAAGVIFMLLARWIPLWIPSIIYVILLGATAIGCIAADITRSEVERIEHDQIRDTAFVKEMRGLALALPVPESEERLGKLVKELQEKLRYSDPVSSEKLKGQEEKIAWHMDLLCNDLSEKSYRKAEERVEQLLGEVESRNALCKAYKQ